MLLLSSCDTSQVDEEENNLTEDSFLSESDLLDENTSNSRTRTFQEVYSERGVLCGDRLIDFPDQSFVANFRIGDKDFTLKNLYEYVKIRNESASVSWELTGLDIEKILEQKNKLYLPFEMLNLLPGELLNISIDWGDGQCNLVTGSSGLIHEYEKPGDYQVRVTGSAHILGNAGYLDGVDLSPKILTFGLSLYEIVELGDLDWKYLYSSFAYTPGLSKFSARHTDTSNVSLVPGLFHGTKLKEIDLSFFDLSSLSSFESETDGITTKISAAANMFAKSKNLELLKLPAITGTINDLFKNKSALGLLKSHTLFEDSNITSTNSSFIIDCGSSAIQLDDDTAWGCREEVNEDILCHHPGVSNSNRPHSIINVYSEETSSLSFNCLDGYIGGGTLTCDPNSGSYEISTGTKCAPMRCASTSVANSNRSSTGIISGVIGDQIEVTCEEGYWGGGVWTCHADRVFKGRSCLPVSYVTSNSKVGVNCNGATVNFPDHSMVLEYSVTPDTEITLPLNDRELKFGGTDFHEAELDLYIDWGDGDCNRVQSPVSGGISHSYDISSNVIVRVTGKALTTKTVASSAGNLKKVINLGDLKLKSYKEAFDGATHLTKFLSDEHKSRYSNVSRGLDFSNMLFDVSENSTSAPNGIVLDFDQLNFSAGYLFENMTARSRAVKVNFDNAKAFNAVSLKSMLSEYRPSTPEFTEVTFGKSFNIGNVVDLSEMFFGLGQFSKIDFKNFQDQNALYRDNIISGALLTNPEKKIYCGGKDYFVNIIGGVSSNVACFSQCSFDLGTELLKSDEGDVVDITCSDGYEFSPHQESLTLTCNFGGFNRNDISCDPKTCSQNIAFGDDISEDFGDGAAVVTCDEGYSPNVSQVTCQADGNFDHEVACIKDGASFTESYASNEVFKCNLDNDDSSDDINVVFTDDSFVQVVGGFTIEEEGGGGGGSPVRLPNVNDLEEPVLPIKYYVDWGDGNCSEIIDSSPPSSLEHIYSEASDKTIRITGVVDNWGKNWTDSNYAAYLKSVVNLGDVGWTDLSLAFSDAQNLESFSAPHTNTSQVTSMKGMFWSNNNSNFTSLNLSNFETGEVINMSNMFEGATNLVTLDLSSFDTGKVQFMHSMFEGVDSLSTLDINNFRYDEVISYTGMFRNTDFESLNLGPFARPKPEISGEEIFTGSNIITGNSRGIISCGDTNQDGNVANGYDILINGLRYPCKHDVPVTCELAVNNLIAGETISAETEFPSVSIIYGCEAGYESTQPGGIICGYDGNFIKSNTTKEILCAPKSCVDATVVNTNTSDPGDDVLLSGGLFGGTQNVTCDASSGYVGGGEWTCALKGDESGNVEWQGETCDLAICEETTPSNSLTNIAEGNFESDEVLVECEDGYTGGGNWSCSIEGVWSGDSCDLIVCNALTPDNSSTAIAQGDYFSPEVLVTCNEGYVGGGTWSCTAGEIWSGDSCEPVVCPDFTPPNTSTTLGAANFETSPESVTCDAGFVGGGEWTCGAEGQWTGPSCDRCQLAVSNLANDGTHLKASTGETISVECSDGFASLINEVTCSETTPGVFGFDQVPECLPASCSIEIANLADSKTHLYGVDGGSAEVTCDAGYEASVSSISCTGETFEEATCEPKACTNFVVGNTNTSDPLDDVELSGVFGDTQNVTCDESSGYAGGGSWECSLVGETVLWQGDSCQLNPCEVFVKNSESGVLNIPHGSISIISCLPGFSGGGVWSCNNGVASGSACTDESTDYSLEGGDVGYLSYVEENFHCDLNQDGNVDVGELVDFPDHSFVATYRVHENDLLNHVAQDVSVTPENDFLVRLPTTGYGVNFYVDWGDGNCEKIEGVAVSSADLTHDYSSSLRPTGDETGTLTDLTGTPINNSTGDPINYYDYTVRIVGVFKSTGGGGSTVYTKYYKDRLFKIIELGDVKWESLNNILYQNKNRFKVTLNASFANTENVTSFNYFITSNSLTQGVDLNLTGLNTINALSLDSMLTSNGNTLRTVDLSSFDTPRNETLSSFLGSSHDLEKLSIVNFDTSNVYNFSSLLYRSFKLESLDLSNIDSLKASTMRNMLNLTTSLKRINFGNWEIQSIPSAPEGIEGHDTIFEGSSIESQIANKKDDGIDIYCHDKKTNLFSGSPQFLGAAGDRQLTENAANGAVSCDGHPPMIVTFKTIAENESVTLGISGGVDVRVFWNDFVCSNSTFLDKAACEAAGGSWDYREEEIVSTDNPTHTFVEPGEYTVWISGYYSACDINNENCTWNTGSFSTINSDWSNNLYQVDTFGDLNAFGVTTMAGAFENNTSLERVFGYVNLPSTLTDLSSLFKNATNLKRVDLSQFNTNHVTNLNSMFEGASSLEIVDFGPWEGSGSTTNFFHNASTVNEANSNGVLRCSYHVESEKTADGGFGKYEFDPVGDDNNYNCWDPVTP